MSTRGIATKVVIFSLCDKYEIRHFLSTTVTINRLSVFNQYALFKIALATLEGGLY